MIEILFTVHEALDLFSNKTKQNNKSKNKAKHTKVNGYAHSRETLPWKAPVALLCYSVLSSPGETICWHCVIFVAVLKRYFIHINLYLSSFIRINIIILRSLNPFPGKHLTPFYFFTNNCSYDSVIWNLLKGVLVWPSLR